MSASSDGSLSKAKKKPPKHRKIPKKNWRWPNESRKKTKLKEMRLLFAYFRRISIDNSTSGDTRERRKALSVCFWFVGRAVAQKSMLKAYQNHKVCRRRTRSKEVNIFPLLFNQLSNKYNTCCHRWKQKTIVSFIPTSASRSELLIPEANHQLDWGLLERYQRRFRMQTGNRWEST